MLKIATKLDTIKMILTSARFKSFYWRSGMMLLAGLIQVILDSATDLQLGTNVTIVLGLILGEISKFLNSNS